MAATSLTPDNSSSRFLDAEEAAVRLARELKDLAGAVRATQDTKAALADASASMNALAEQVRTVAESSRESIDVIKEASGPRILDEVASVEKQVEANAVALERLQANIAASTQRITYLVATSIVLGIAAIILSLVR